MISHNPHAGRRILPLALTILLTAQTLPATAATPDTYIGPDQGLWSDPTNWSAGTPNSVAFDVFLTDSAGLTTLLDTTETIDNLTIAAPDILSFNPSESLTVKGTTFSNAGTILINQSDALDLYPQSPLTGNGSITLTDPTSKIVISLTSNNIITGQGLIQSGALTNGGTITATSGLLAISGTLSGLAPTTNAGLMSADGGTLSISGASLNNSTGVVLAAHSSAAMIQAFLIGGTVTALSGSTVSLIGATGAVLQTPDNSGTILLGGTSPVLLTNPTNDGFAEFQGSSTILNGTITNNGQIYIPANTTISVTNTIKGSNSFVLNGSGTLVLAQYPTSRLVTGVGGEPEANNSTIYGSGIVAISGFVNNGLIQVAPGGTLSLSDIRNGGLIKADSGLVEFPNQLDNTDGIIDVGDGTVTLLRALGGTITGSGGTVAASAGLEGSSSQIMTILGSLAPLMYTSLGDVDNEGTITIVGPAAVAGNVRNGGLLTLVDTLQIFTNVLVNAGTLTGSASVTSGPVANSGLVLASSGGALGLSLSQNTGTARADGGTLTLSGSFTNTGGLIQSLNGSALVISNATISGGSITTSGVILPPLLPKDSPVLSINPLVLQITGSNVQLDSFTSTAFSSAPSIQFYANTIAISNSTLSITGGLTLLGGANLAFSSGTFTVLGPITLASVYSDSDPQAFASAQIFFASSIPNSQNVGPIIGDGGVTVGVNASLVSDGDTAGALTLEAQSRMTIRAGDGDAGTSKFTTFNLAGTTNAWTATLDITDNKLIIQTGSAPLLDKTSAIEGLQNQLQSAKNGASGPWTGTGITSSTVAQDAATQTSHSYKTTLALYDNADLGYTTWGGQTVDSNSLLITRALVADANLDNTINNADLVALLTHFGLNNQTQSTGDYDGNGTVDNADLVALLTNYGQSLPGSFSLQPSPQTASLPPATSVPEPASLWLLAALLPLLAVRKSRIV